jgi:hypothetical protein
LAIRTQYLAVGNGTNHRTSTFPIHSTTSISVGYVKAKLTLWYSGAGSTLINSTQCTQVPMEKAKRLKIFLSKLISIRVINLKKKLAM